MEMLSTVYIVVAVIVLGIIGVCVVPTSRSYLSGLLKRRRQGNFSLLNAEKGSTISIPSLDGEQTQWNAQITNVTRLTADGKPLPVINGIDGERELTLYVPPTEQQYIWVLSHKVDLKKLGMSDSRLQRLLQSRSGNLHYQDKLYECRAYYDNKERGASRESVLEFCEVSQRSGRILVRQSDNITTMLAGDNMPSSNCVVQ